MGKNVKILGGMVFFVCGRIFWSYPESEGFVIFTPGERKVRSGKGLAFFENS